MKNKKVVRKKKAVATKKRPTPQQYAKMVQHPKWQKKRLRVFQRDKWKCRQCGNTEVTLHVHHKVYTKYYPWNELMKNLITLCAHCHKKGHKK